MGNSRKKLFLTLILSMGLLLGMTACSSPVEMMLGEPVIIEEHVELTARNVIVSKEMFPPAASSQPMGWVVEDDNKTFVAVVADIKNLRDDKMTVHELWKSFSMYMKQDHCTAMIVALVTDEGKKLDCDGSIAPGETETAYFVLELDDFDLQERMEAQWSFDHAPDAVLPVDATIPVAQYETAEKGDIITIAELGSVALKSFAFAKELEPDKPGYTFEYYMPSEEDDTLFVVTTEVKNSTKEVQSSYEYLNMMVFAKGQVYLADIVADDDHGSNILRGESLDAKEKKRVYGVVSIPETLKKEDLDVYLYIDGAYYRCDVAGKEK